MIGNGRGVKAKSVLIVDRCEDNREVLRTALERRGMQTLEACSARQGLQLMRRHQPAVIVWDVEGEGADDEAVQYEFNAETERQNASLVVLGTARRKIAAQPCRSAMSKPYHYTSLIRTIEQLLTH